MFQHSSHEARAAPEGTVATPGRGAAYNPAIRFEKMVWQADPGEGGERRPTEVFRDLSQSILTANDSPDIGFSYSLNPYRGCEHGCIYCYARPTHEYLGWSSGLDFESRILVKENAAALFERELAKPAWQGEPIALSGVTDPYQPLERKLEITRQCLAVAARCRQPLSLITKGITITRDLDLLVELARWQAVRVTVSITTPDTALARQLEPRAATPAARLQAVAALAAAGVPVGVNFAPLIPGLNDEHLGELATAARDAGAQWLGTTLLRLPYAVKDLFFDWLDRHHPGKRARVEARLRACRGGALNVSAFGDRMRGSGWWAEQYRAALRLHRHRCGLAASGPPLTSEHFLRPGATQLALGLG